LNVESIWGPKHEQNDVLHENRLSFGKVMEVWSCSHFCPGNFTSLSFSSFWYDFLQKNETCQNQF